MLRERHSCLTLDMPASLLSAHETPLNPRISFGLPRGTSGQALFFTLLLIGYDTPDLTEYTVDRIVQGTPSFTLTGHHRYASLKGSARELNAEQLTYAERKLIERNLRQRLRKQRAATQQRPAVRHTFGSPAYATDSVRNTNAGL